MVTAYIGVGSNLGNKAQNCLKALEHMAQGSHTSVEARSSLYRTEPVGNKDQDWFVNCVAKIKTPLAPRELLSFLLAIERAMGRERKEKWGPRVIDLDILFYGDMVVEQEGLTIPHPLIKERRFVLVPMAELAPNFLHPVLGKNMAQLLALCPSEGQEVRPLEMG